MSSTKLSEFYEDFHTRRDKRGTVDIGSRIRFIVDEVGKGKRVLELGCRFGGLLQYFVDGNKVTGCDIDRRSLQECAQLYGIDTHIVNLNESLPFDSNSFDVVVLSEVLEHLPYPDITLAEASRILCADGKFVGSVPNGIHFRNRLRFLVGGPVELDPTHLHHFSSGSLFECLKRQFKNIQIESTGGRYIAFSKELFSKTLLFTCTKK